MKKILLTILFLNAIVGFAQPQLIKQRCIGSKAGDEIFRDVVFDKNNNIFWAIVDANDSIAEFNNKPYAHPAALLKFDTSLDLLDVKYFGGSNGSSLFTKITLNAKDNSLYCSGYTNATNGDCAGGTGNDFFIVKVDNNGNKIWSHCYAWNNGSSGAGVLPIQKNILYIPFESDYSGGIIPSHYGSTMGVQDVGIFKIDSVGNLGWVKMYGGSDIDRLYGFGLLKEDSLHLRVDVGSYSNDYNLAGTFGNTDSLKHWIFICDTAGNIVKQKFERGYLYFGGSGFVFSKYKNNQTLMVGGGLATSPLFPTTPSHQGLEGMVALYDSSLNLLSMKQWGGSNDDNFSSYCRDAMGNYYFGGQTRSSDGDINSVVHGQANFWIIKTDSNFNKIWSRTFGGSQQLWSTTSVKIFLKGNKLFFWGYCFPPAILPDFDLECGHAYDGNLLNYYTEDAWVAVFDLNTTIANIEGPPTPPTEEELYQEDFVVYPSPFSRCIQLKSINPDGNPMQVIVIDVAGKVVINQTLQNIEKNFIDADKLSNGMYILNIYSKGHRIYTDKITAN